MKRTSMVLCCVVVALAAHAQTPATADHSFKPYTFSNFRTPPEDRANDQFVWGNGSELFYVHRHPSGSFIYALNLLTNRSELITKGTSPAFHRFTHIRAVKGSVDSAYFLRETGYSIEKELWRYDHFLDANVQGEHILSTATIRVDTDIFVSPTVDWSNPSVTFAYRYYGSMSEGGFSQIRITRTSSDFHTYQTAILYSRGPDDRGVPSISGWLDANTLVCFIRNEPYRLKVDFRSNARASRKHFC